MGCPADRRAGAVPSLPPGYQLLGPLGGGGMGVVYKAVQPRVSRVVAVKIIRVGLHADPRVVARFRTEIEAVARLQHPNIVPISEVASTRSCRSIRWNSAPAAP
jgi:serine/threonine-protein kinase